jgi:hypothetical protein
MPTDPLCPWPDDQMERIEAKLDRYHEETGKALYDHHGRLTKVESDIGTFKKAGAAIGGVSLPMIFEWIKTKAGL